MKKASVNLLLTNHTVLEKGNKKDISKLKFNLSDLEHTLISQNTKANTFILNHSHSSVFKNNSIKPDDFFNPYIDKNNKKLLIVTKEFKVSKKVMNNLFLYFDYVIKSDLNYFNFLNYASKIYHSFNNEDMIHASFVSVFGEGVLITGKPGIGKSELLMSLVKQGHFFIGDDAIKVYFDGNHVYGEAVNSVKNFVEIRGIGIINAKKIFGTQYCIPKHKVDYIVHLENLSSLNDNKNRIKNHYDYEMILDRKVKKITLNVTSGKTLTDIVEFAISNEKSLKYDNYNSNEEFISNFHKIRKEEN